MSTSDDPARTLPMGTIRLPGGEMKRLTYAQDWAGTPLGPINQWPSCLKSAVDIMLNSLYPMLI